MSIRKQAENCPNCEQPVPLNIFDCPHCHQPVQINLDVGKDFETYKVELNEKLQMNPEDTATRSELTQLLYAEAMKYRYDDPRRALHLFREAYSYDPNHIESALKNSWLAIKYGHYEEAESVLLPVVDNPDATPLQKQRAYTNLACCMIWNPKQQDLVKAEEYSRKGIEIDGEGTSKLWENLATALKSQNRLAEARDAFKKALQLNPKSLNAIERQASIDRHLKIEYKKKQKTEKGSTFKIRSPRDLFGGRKSDFLKL